MPDRGADAGLTPNQRAGQTKRDRTRHRILRATESLLDGPFGYDEIRVADIADRGATGVATVHQVYGQKAAIVGELFLELYRPLHEETKRQLADGSNPLDVLVDHLSRTGRAAGRQPHLTRAYVRAYATEALLRPNGSSDHESIWLPFDMCQILIDRGRRLNVLPESFSVGRGLGAQMTLFLLGLVAEAAPDDVDLVTDRTLNILLHRS